MAVVHKVAVCKERASESKVNAYIGSANACFWSNFRETELHMGPGGTAGLQEAARWCGPFALCPLAPHS